MLELKKPYPFTWDYILVDEGELVGRLNCAVLRLQATATLEGEALKMTKSGALKKVHKLMNASDILVETSQMDRPGHHQFEHQGLRYRFRDPGPLTYHMLIEREDKEIGRIQRRGVWSLCADVDLPLTFPLRLRVFLGWMAIGRWRERSRNR